MTQVAEADLGYNSKTARNNRLAIAGCWTPEDTITDNIQHTMGMYPQNQIGTRFHPWPIHPHSQWSDPRYYQTCLLSTYSVLPIIPGNKRSDIHITSAAHSNFYVNNILRCSMRAPRTSSSVSAPEIILCLRTCTCCIRSSTVSWNNRKHLRFQ